MAKQRSFSDSFPFHDFKVALITMPFFPINTPSIQIGLLHAIAEHAGFPVDSFHLNLHMAARLRTVLYDVLSLNSGCMIAEWLFSESAFGTPQITLEDFLGAFPEEMESLRKAGVDLHRLKGLGKLAPRFLDECMTLADWGKYRLVGFSSTFQQNVASLALAKRIKAKHPHVNIVFGGANMDGEMGPEYLRALSYIDYVISGEGDFVFPALLNRLAAGQPVDDLPGTAFRSITGIQVNPPPPAVQDMDSLPVPNYDDYFARCKKLRLPHNYLQTYLPVETARGCWWGEKHHCTFCGLNGLNMRFRAKSIPRVLNELAELSDKYHHVHFTATDNILDLTYLKELFTRLHESSGNYRFFWEIKSNLSREQIRTLYLGGVRVLQPGIDSLNTHLLQLMRKGCTTLQNLMTMRWCRYYGIHMLWNLLHGFPGEREEDYLRQLAILKLIPHLEPPLACLRIDLERFAPYFFDREHFPVKNIRPLVPYSYIYPPNIDLQKIAYFFDYEMENTVPEKFHDDTKQWLDLWKRNWLSGRFDSLTFHQEGQKLVIYDNRTTRKIYGHCPTTHELNGPAAVIYQYCSDRYRSLNQITDELQAREDRETIQEILDSFCDSGIMVSEDGKYLALALPA